jgi:hypothetical protein
MHDHPRIAAEQDMEKIRNNANLAMQAAKLHPVHNLTSRKIILLRLKKTNWLSRPSRPSRRSLRSQELLNQKTGLIGLSGAMTCQGNIVET